MRAGPGFRGSLVNVDVSSDPNIDHLTIDKSPRLHARVISEVLAVVGGHHGAPPNGVAPHEATHVPAPGPSGAEGAAKPEAAPATPAAPAKSGDGAMNTSIKPLAESSTVPIIALPERSGRPAVSAQP
jgi:hypothetical protein